MASDILITDNNYGISANIEGYEHQNFFTSPVKIGNSGWFGSTIGERAIIFLNNVVRRGISAYMIAVGLTRLVKRWNFETGSWDRI